MKTSVNWINDYLDPPASAEEQADLLTAAGFPWDGGDVVDGEPWQEIETTSNRGDCLCHIGLAREIATLSDRTLREPDVTLAEEGPDVARRITVNNHESELCPLYTARVITGVRVGPSPDWLQRRLRAIGQIPRNNLVDATNFVLFEYGQPTHVFDLAKLAGRQINVRRARPKERFLPLGEGAESIELDERDLVIADAERSVALAGVKGGADTAVNEDTVDVLLEAATFAPVAVRDASRRHRIASDSSYRFERGVHPAEVARAADRLAALILEIAGGTLDAGVVADGRPMPPARVVSMRPDRCRRLLGRDLETSRMIDLLAGLGFDPRETGDRIDCSVPPRRLDIEREADLVEEIARCWGLDQIPVADTMELRVAAPQPHVEALRAVRSLLVGTGFVETVTHTLIGERAAALFTPAGGAALSVDDERAGGEPCLRPSIVPSLLRVRRTNHDRGVRDVSLFETAAVFHRAGQRASDEHAEREVIALVHDAPVNGDATDAYRALRGVVERLLTMLLGRDAAIAIEAAEEDGPRWLAPAARVVVNGAPIGFVGILAPEAAALFDAEHAVACAELEIRALCTDWPPLTQARALPSQPPIERDLSVVLEESTPWAAIESLVADVAPDRLDELVYVGTYRGKQVGAGRKSVTLRLRFRDSERTLRHEEVDPAIDAVQTALRDRLGGEIRS